MNPMSLARDTTALLTGNTSTTRQGVYRGTRSMSNGQSERLKRNLRDYLYSCHAKSTRVSMISASIDRRVWGPIFLTPKYTNDTKIAVFVRLSRRIYADGDDFQPQKCTEGTGIPSFVFFVPPVAYNKRSPRPCVSARGFFTSPVLWVFVYLRGIRPLIWADKQVRPHGWVAASLRQVLRVFRG